MQSKRATSILQLSMLSCFPQLVARGSRLTSHVSYAVLYRDGRHERVLGKPYALVMGAVRLRTPLGAVEHQLSLGFRGTTRIITRSLHVILQGL